MDLDDLKVEHGGLDRVADDLMTIVNRVGCRMEELDRELSPLRTQWVGDAQLAYAASKQRWDAAIAEMRELLQVTARQVTQSNAEYRAADERGARSFDI